MSQHDMEIANQTASSARADINNALQALASNSLGTGEPSPTYAGQFWFDTTNSKLKIRNEGNSGWLDFANIGSTLVPSPGFASEAEATTGTNTTKFMNPALVKAATFPSKDLSGDGYIEMPGGLLMQWGYFEPATTPTTVTITYPTPFQEAVYCFQVTRAFTSQAYLATVVDSGFRTSLTTATIYRQGGYSIGESWFALGV